MTETDGLDRPRPLSLLHIQDYISLTRLELRKVSKSSIFNDAGWSSLVARRAHNPKVVGSNPTPATN